MFEWIKTYDHAHELRDWNTLVSIVQRPPLGSVHALLGARRSGKTWALAALRAAIGTQARVLDLRNYQDQLPNIEADTRIVFVDEPGPWIFESGHSPEHVKQHGLRLAAGRILQLLDWCRELRHRDVKVTMALTSAEWSALLDAGKAAGIIEPDDLQEGRLGPLTRAAAQKVARTPAAARLFEQLSDEWTRNPFLLNLILAVGLDGSAPFVGELTPERIAELEREAITEAFGSKHEYDYHVIYQGLTLAQRDIVRAVCRGRVVAPSDDCRLLERMGIIRKQGNGYVPGDPAVAAAIPSVLRIHHVSDLHFGAKSGKRVDVKDETQTGQRLAVGAGQGPVVDDYYDWLRSRPASQRPHLLIVSGDIAEQARESEYELAIGWLNKVAAELAPHADLRADDPRVLLVPGNHDVNWNEPPSHDGERRRHLPFARAFGEPTWLRPRLEQPPEARGVASHLFRNADLEVLLLSSCEYGGLRDLGIERITALAEGQGDLTLEQAAKEIKGSYGRQDPGLVHDHDIQAARRHPWSGRVRIAVLHHPLSPVPTVTEIAPSVGLLNAGQLKGALLQQGFCLALHGHVHSPWVGSEQWHGPSGGKLLICSAPTLGSYETYHGHGFNEISILREGQHHAVEVQPFVRRDRTNFSADGEPIRIDVRKSV